MRSPFLPSCPINLFSPFRQVIRSHDFWVFSNSSGLAVGCWALPHISGASSKLLFAPLNLHSSRVRRNRQRLPSNGSIERAQSISPNFPPSSKRASDRALVTIRPEPVPTGQQLKLRHPGRRPNVRRLATMLGDHSRHPIRLTKSYKAEHCSKEDTVPEGGTQDSAFLADQADCRNPDRYVLR